MKYASPFEQWEGEMVLPPMFTMGHYKAVYTAMQSGPKEEPEVMKQWRAVQVIARFDLAGLDSAVFTPDADNVPFQIVRWAVSKGWEYISEHLDPKA